MVQSGSAPIGAPDAYVVANDQVLTVEAPGLSANDIDPDGDSFIVSNFVPPSHGTLTSIVTSGAFTYVPDAGFTGTDSFTYTLRDDEGEFSDPVTVTIDVVAVNAPPEVTAATADPIDEGGEATLSVSFTDPDVGDTHSAVVDWGDGTSTSLGAVISPFTTTHVYGDDGVYTVTVTVTDAVGDEDSTTLDLAVENLAPSVAIDGSDVIVGVVGGDTSVSATATDPGSDDLGFLWSTGTSATYFNDGAGPDPALSPGGTFPFTASDTTTVSFTSIGVGTVDVTVTDDDGGSATDSVTTVAVDDADETRTQGFWSHQYSGKGEAQYDESTLEAFLAITGVTSSVFSEEVPATTVEEADAVLNPSSHPKAGGDGREAAEMREKATAQLLAAWLNFAAGGVAWDEPIDTGVEGVGVAPFHEVVAAAENILLDADATHADLERAKDLAEAINRHNEG